MDVMFDLDSATAPLMVSGSGGGGGGEAPHYVG
jgi:hypothetical protein